MQPGVKLYGNIFSHLPLGFRTCQKSLIIEIRLELEGSFRISKYSAVNFEGEHRC